MMLDGLQDLDPKRENLDPFCREILTRLLNEIEAIYKENQELRAENQRLRDEIAQLKGHKGKPKIKANRPPKSATSSEKAKGQFYEAQLPVGVRGKSYGKELEAFVVMLYYQLRVPQEKILKLLQFQGIVISAGKIAHLLSQQYLEEFTIERNELLKAGLASTSYQHIDDTGMRVKTIQNYQLKIQHLDWVSRGNLGTPLAQNYLSLKTEA